MKRVMFICLGLNNGGVARVISILSGALNSNSYKLFILSLSKGEESYLVDDRVTLLYPVKESVKPGFKQISRIQSIRKSIVENNIDVVLAFSHYNAMYAVLAAKMLNVKLVGSERNDPAQLENKKLLNWLRLRLYKKLDCLVCQTDDAKAYFPPEIQKKAVVILNPITGTLPEPYRGKRKNRVVSFSRLEPQKNIPMLIDAFAEFHKSHQDYVLDIYGNGSLRDSLVKSVTEQGLEHIIRFRPYTTDVHNAILDASMFALSSNFEGLSNSMLEAMAIGLPTIVTDCPCGGARMVIEDGVNGILVPVGDSSKMSEAMCRVAEDEGLADRLSRNGMKIRERLKKDRIAAQWEEVINW